MAPPPSFVKDISLGLLMGTYGILLLYGMTVMQAYQYYTNFPKDRLLLKALVALIITLETVTLALSCHHNYYYLIEHYGEPKLLIKVVWSIRVAVEISFIIAWLVNMFFVRRIYVMSMKKLWIAIPIAIVVTIRPAFGIAANNYSFKYPEWKEFHDHVQWMLITGLSIGLFADFLIASTLSFYLLQNRETSIPSTRNLVNILLWYTINTTAILTFFAAIEMIFLLAQPKTLTFLGLFSIQIQMYANCFLTTLNARHALRRGVRDVTPMVTTLNVAVRTENQTRMSAANIGVKTDAFLSSRSDNEEQSFNVEKPTAV
jgi:hypothetical protein